MMCSAAYVQAEESEKVGTDTEVLEVEKVKEKYWAQGEQSQLGVVQNRTYSKSGKLQLGLIGGRASDDPFLSTLNYGLNVGYNFSEFWGASLVGMKYSVSPSNALKILRSGGKEANTVAPKNYIGGEATGSFLYGKLSLMGASIIYYDMHFTAGGGLTKTENDAAAVTESVGIGQRFYITKALSLRMDYRFQTFIATEKEKEITARLGEVNGKLRHYNHVLAFELGYMFDLGGGGSQ
ncbi:MAG: outer membrane beta-barrel domain-containing protein [Bdellovibrionota bacterium]